MKKISLIFAIILAMGMLQGCGPQNGSDSIDITVVTPFHEQDGNRSNFVNAYKAFEQETGYTVNDQASESNEEWKNAVMNSFSAGDAPDVLFYFTGIDADELVKNDMVVSLDEILRTYPDYASNMKGSMIPVSTANGRQYAVPVNGYWEGLFVNKKVLADCGIAEPGADYTWDQFLADCAVIKANGYTPIACSLMDVPHYWFEFATFNNSDIINHRTMPSSAQDDAGKAWAKGLEDIKDLYDRGFFPDNTTVATDSETSRLMLEDEAAFMIDGSWKVGWFKENASDINDFMVTYVPAKGDRKPTEIIGGISMGYYITKKAWDDPEKRDACVQFVNAMTTDEVVSNFGTISVTALVNPIEPDANADSLVTSALKMLKNATGYVAAAQDMLDPAARKMLFEDVRNIATGDISPQQAIDKCLGVEE